MLQGEHDSGHILVMQEKGLGKVLLHDLGLETVAQIDRPAMIGEELQLQCTQVDVHEGVARLAATADFAPADELRALAAIADGDVEEDAPENLRSEEVDVHDVIGDDVGVRPGR